MPTRRIAYAYYDPDWIKGEHTLLALKGILSSRLLIHCL